MSIIEVKSGIMFILRKIMINATLFFSIILCFLNKVQLLNNGVARTPPMGWMSWGYYMCGIDCEENPNMCLDEKLILSVADVFYNEGYQEAGYEYIIIDDCWSEKQRDEYGRLVPDRKRFPRGMRFIADYIHKRGLKFGMYTNVADITCMHYPGSKDHFKTDAETFAAWGVDYLKVDGCFVKENYLNVAYIGLGARLNRTGRPMVYSCSWPYYIQFIHHKEANYKKISEECNMWRNYHDVVGSWAALRAIIQYYEQQYPLFHQYHGPGHWNDPDMLIFGRNVLTDSQSRVHIAVYAMLSAPLLLSCDMASISPYEKKLLQNLDLMAIAQDALGYMAEPHKIGAITLWVKKHIPLKGNLYHSFSFALVNLNTESHAVSFTPTQYGLNSIDGYTVMDVFSSMYFRNITIGDSFTVDVPAEDVVMYTIFPL